MNVVDSSGWLEYFTDGPNANYFSGPLRDLEGLIVPTISMYEVFKVVLRERSEDEALQAIALMKQGTEIELTSALAIQAAKISSHYRMPMADSIILTTAQAHQATVWTQDEDFKGIDGVKYFPKAATK
ncbi:MAG: type II toxin-antitoxin system VapC family toxin [Thermodesulfobacteriota bacterium]